MAKIKIKIPNPKLQITKIIAWVRNNRVEALTLFLILLAAAFLRFWRLPEYMTFLGDEGRDVIIVRRFVVNFDPMLIGPQTSIGNMYLGPLYYYMMAPALALFGLSPVGPATQIALLGVLTVWFVWYVAREWFGPPAGGVAAALYAVSPVVITYSQSSWNPNIMPFFALLSVYAIWRVWRHHEWKWLLILGVSYAFVLQSHYLGLLLAPTLGGFWLLSLINVWKDKKERLVNIRYSLIAAAIFLLLMSPLIIFDARHGWRNFEAMKIFFSERQTTVSARPWNAIPQLWPLTQQISERLLAGKNQALGGWVGAALVFSAAWLTIIQRRNISKAWPFGLVKSPLFLLLSWIGFGLIGLGLYKQQIYDHYFGFFFAAPFILVGSIAQNAIEKIKPKNLAALAVLIATLALAGLNLVETPIRYSPNRQLQRTQSIAAKIAEEAGGQPFNLAVIAERNYEDAYQYFLEWWREPVRDIDPLQLDKTLTEQLFVVCEQEECEPINHPKAEIANFGWAKIENEWGVVGVHLFKLVHAK